MAYHIPFNQRHRKPPVVYIGFEAPRPPRRKFNWWGFNGLWMSLAAFLSAGLFSPIALLVSMRGLKQKPRRMAVAGTVLSLAGTALFAGIVFTVVSSQAHRKHIAQMHLQNALVQQQVVETEQLIDTALVELVEFREGHGGQLPNWVDGNMLLLKHLDSWGESLRFDAEEEFAIIRSAGPDRQFDTDDDLTEKVLGKTDRQVLLPL